MVVIANLYSFLRTEFLFLTICFLNLISLVIKRKLNTSESINGKTIRNITMIRSRILINKVSPVQTMSVLKLKLLLVFSKPLYFSIRLGVFNTPSMTMIPNKIQETNIFLCFAFLYFIGWVTLRRVSSTRVTYIQETH